MMIQPVFDNLIIEVYKEENDKTNSGIILPKAVQAKPDRGTVIAVGTGRMLNNGTLLKPIVEVGNVIMFNKFAGTEIVADNKIYLLIKENDIIAKIIEE